MNNEREMQIELRGLANMLKAALIENVATASRQKKISIDEHVLAGLKLLLDATVDQTFVNGTKNILKLTR